MASLALLLLLLRTSRISEETLLELESCVESESRRPGQELVGYAMRGHLLSVPAGPRETAHWHSSGAE